MTDWVSHLLWGVEPTLPATRPSRSTRLSQYTSALKKGNRGEKVSGKRKRPHKKFRRSLQRHEHRAGRGFAGCGRARKVLLVIRGLPNLRLSAIGPCQARLVWYGTSGAVFGPGFLYLEHL
jgi:hypothetical protein